MDVFFSWFATIAVGISAAIAGFAPAYAISMRGKIKHGRASAIAFVIFASIPLVFVSVADKAGGVSLWIPLTVGVLGLIGGGVAGWDAARAERKRGVAE